MHSKIKIKSIKILLFRDYTVKPVFADMLYSGHLVIADTFSWSRLNRNQTFREKPVYSGHLYSK